MNALKERTELGYEILADLHPMVVARIVCEWARVDPLFPMRFWGNDMLGSHATIGNDRWYVGNDAQQASPTLQLTLDKNVLGKSEGQFTWRISIADLHEKGCRAELRPV